MQNIIFKETTYEHKQETYQKIARLCVKMGPYLVSLSLSLSQFFTFWRLHNNNFLHLADLWQLVAEPILSYVRLV